MAQKLLGTSGAYAILFLILMAVMSTGSAEVIAVASIVIYDVYQVYICPFRPGLKAGQCILCGRNYRGGQGEGEGEVPCNCVSANNCEGCRLDQAARQQSKSIVKPHHTCPVHREYKEYQEHLLNYKNWCIVVCTFLSVPLCLFCWTVNLNLAWTYYFTGILISSSVVPIAMSITWARATAAGLISGVVGGCAVGMISWLSFASTFPGGLSAATFVSNTGQEMPMLTGNCVAITMGAIISTVVTFLTRRNMTKEMEEEEWNKTRDIDNPLSPWVAKYQGELDLEMSDMTEFHEKPPMDLVVSKFRTAKLTAWSAAVAFTVVFVGIWPGSMLATDILDKDGFTVWTTLSRGWAYLAAAFIVIVPLAQELRAVQKQLKRNKTEMESSSSCVNKGFESQEVNENNSRN